MIKEPVIDEVVARKFLLGQLSPEEQGQIEELAFEDPDTFTLLESVEEDLVDEYLRDELSPLERKRFNEYFLSFPGRRQNLKISEVLQEYFNPQYEVTTGEREEANHDDPNYSFLGGFLDWVKIQSFWSRTITAAILVATLLFIVWFIWQKEKQPDPIQAGPGTPITVPSPEPQISPSLHPSPSPVPTENKRTTPTPERQKPEPARGRQKPEPAPEMQKPVPTYATLIPSAVTRGGEAQQLHLPPDASTIPVGLVLSDRRIFRTYDVTLHNEAGRELYRWSNLRPQTLAAKQNLPPTKEVVIDVRTALLEPDEIYRLRLTGVSSEGERSSLQGYSFEAKK